MCGKIPGNYSLKHDIGDQEKLINTTGDMKFMDKNQYGTKSLASKENKLKRISLAEVLRNSPIPDNELTGNLGLYIERMHLSRIILMHELYKRIVDVPGVIIKFGVRWGQNICLFNSFRGMYEPYNYTRKIIGFDTFSGFPSITIEDNKPNNKLKVGDYSVSSGYQQYLENILAHHESLSPLPYIKKTELVVGDACTTFPQFLKDNPEIIVSMAYFDFDIYTPTKICLEALLPRLTKGSLVVFDELNCKIFPGETVAVQEVLGTNNLRLEREPNNPFVSWFVF